MRNNYVVSLLGYACNGKSTLWKRLPELLKEEFSNYNIIPIQEPVNYPFLISKLTDIDFKNKQIRQSLILTSALAQLDTIFTITRNTNNTIIIMDRSIVDAFIFTYLDIDNKEFLSEFKVIKELIAWKYDIDLTKDIMYNYLLPTDKKDIIRNCFKREDRKLTISLEEYYENELKFREKCQLLQKKVGLPIVFHKHPADTDKISIYLSSFIKIKLDNLLNQ